MSSNKAVSRNFVSFRSSSSNLDEKKQDDYQEDQAMVRDDILADISPEAWFQVSLTLLTILQGMCATR